MIDEGFMVVATVTGATDDFIAFLGTGGLLFFYLYYDVIAIYLHAVYGIRW